MNTTLQMLTVNVGLNIKRCKLQKNHKSKRLSSGWVVDISKWFRIWGVDDLLEFSDNAMQYVMIEERLVE